jgi:adenylate cyclase
MSEVLRLAERGIELAGGDSTKGKMMTGSPLTLIVALRGMARCCLGIAGWRDDFERAVSMGRTAEPITRSAALYFTYVAANANAILSPTVAVLCEAEEALTFAEQSGGDVAVGQGIQYLGILLVRSGGSSRAKGFQLLDQVRTMALEQRYNAAVVPLTDILLAEERMRIGDIAGAISLSRPAVNEFFVAGDVMWAGYGTNVLVEALLRRKISADLENAKVAVDRLAATPVEPDFVVHRIWLLRAQALLARAYGDNAAYQDHRDRYRKMANDLGFEGHITMAESMP